MTGEPFAVNATVHHGSQYDGEGYRIVVVRVEGRTERNEPWVRHVYFNEETGAIVATRP